MTPPLVLVPQYFGALVFDRRTSRYAPFDHAAAALLAAAIEVPAFAVARDDEDAIAFVEHFTRAGYFAPDGTFAGVALPVPAGGLPGDRLLGPLAVHVEVIAACNLTCTHCFAGDLPRKTALTTRELDRVFGELAALGSFRIGLTGGEPLLRKDLLDVIDAALAHGLHPCLTTNGTLLDERLARELGRRDLVWVNVSLEGARAETNDRVRGDGTFDAVVERLRAVGHLMRYTLAFTITSHNAREVEACAELARELGAHTAVFRPVYPAGTARAHPELAPTYAEYTGALARLAGLGCDVNPIDPLVVGTGAAMSGAMSGAAMSGAAMSGAAMSGAAMSGAAMSGAAMSGAAMSGAAMSGAAMSGAAMSGAAMSDGAFSPAQRAATQAITYRGPGCGAANLVASISATGEVNPCSFLGTAFESGTLRERSFREIWNAGHAFRRLREQQAGDTFRGGCRARALAAHGSAFARDPWHDESIGAPSTPHPLTNLHVARRLPVVPGDR